ncbi:MAG: CocE/NonD family hydrolase, partial [Acidobacteriaceae bacterium]|nr:CocE/NonD family hydrolase [Acidobacteriaceae bacterium]
TQSRVPNLNVAGWWDQEDFYGPLKIYDTLERTDSRKLNYLVVGPWNHGGWARGTGRKLGIVDFGSDTAKYFREDVEAPWFAYWLKDQGTLKQPEALTFQTGTNRWVSYDSWPPQQGVANRKLYFRADGKLSFEAPLQNEPNSQDSYESDPAHPVPYRHRPISSTYPGPAWTVWLTEDQRFVHLRPDVLSWETEPLDSDMAVSGDIVANLYAATTGSDSDWVVKLIDVYPEKYESDPTMAGYQLIIADEVLRARYRNGFVRPEPLKPGAVTSYRLDLHGNNHAFLKGHRIMVQVQSTWFPLIDRNPQKFVANIFLAHSDDYQKATQTVYRSAAYPSNVELPVAESGAGRR